MTGYDRDRFIKNIDWIIENKCGGNKARFNSAIGQRSADYRWRAEKYLPRLEAVIKVCEVFNVDIRWLLGLETKRQPVQKGDADTTELKELLEHYKEIAHHYKKMYEDLSDQLDHAKQDPQNGAKSSK